MTTIRVFGCHLLLLLAIFPEPKNSPQAFPLKLDTFLSGNFTDTTETINCATVTSQIQTEIDNMFMRGGGIVSLPCGRTSVSTITLRSGVKLVGGMRGQNASSECTTSVLSLCQPQPYIIALSGGHHEHTAIEAITFECYKLIDNGNAPGNTSSHAYKRR